MDKRRANIAFLASALLSAVVSAQYDWGNPCNSLTMDLCQQQDCLSCKFSWPTGAAEMSQHPDAACRCEKVRSGWTWGEDCAELTDKQFCKDVTTCNSCRKAWPPNRSWQDSNSACRCEDIDGFTSLLEPGNQMQSSDVPTQAFPPLEVEVDGQAQTLYVQHPIWTSEITTDKNSLSFDYNNRMYLSTVDSVDPRKYFKINLLGGSVSFDVDLSKSGCGCLTAFYTIGMPAIDNRIDPFMYCDSRLTGGHYCPQFDLMEANRHAFRGTAHSCSLPQSGTYYSCDRTGDCAVDVLLNFELNDFGPGADYTINTEKAFNVDTQFIEKDGQFHSYTTTLTQDGRTVSMGQGECNDYLKDMTQVIQNMAFAFQHYSSYSLDWLQHKSCTGFCDEEKTLSTFSNIKIKTGVKPSRPDEPDIVVPPVPKPVEPVQPTSKSFPPLDVKVDDVVQTLYVHYPELGDDVSTFQDNLSFDYNNRMYLSTVEKIDPSKYFKVNLLGGSVSFDIDLSKSGCGCITALYAVGMPAAENSFSPFQYCDASKTGGYYCPEFDLMHANRHAYRTNAHRCDAPSATGLYSSCDTTGQCAVDILQNEGDYDYGPSYIYTINTEKPFSVNTVFYEKDGEFTGYTTTFVQEGNKIVMDKKDCSDYLKDLTSQIQNMVITVSNFGESTIDWLQHGVCSGTCNKSQTFSVFSNIEIYTKGNVPASHGGGSAIVNPDDTWKPKSIDDYEWGNDCTSLSDQLCQQYDCAVCKWSWPLGKTFGDSDGACRCQSLYSQWSWGDECPSRTTGYCNEVLCGRCLASWPTGEDLNHPMAACRCENIAQFSRLSPDQMPAPVTVTRPDIAIIDPVKPKADTFPSLEVQVDDVAQTLYVHYPQQTSAITTDKDSLSFDFNNRMYLSTVERTDPSKYFKINLLGGSLSFDIDLSKSGCGCLTALYAVMMPAGDNNSDPFQYCDASKVGGHYCPEFDLMQANRHAYRATAHRCDAPDATGKFSSCDHNGKCAVDVLLNKVDDDFGTGESFTINTEKVFNVDTRFSEVDGKFTSYKTILSQEGRLVTLEKNDCSDYLKDMTEAIQNMVISINNWSSYSFDWLQHSVCSGYCDEKTTLSVFSNIKVYTKGKVPAEPTTKPVAKPDQQVVPVDTPKKIDFYDWGTECTDLNNQLCQQYDCALCYQSWPVGETSKHSDATCRCRQMNTMWAWGQDCASNTEQYCSEVTCNSCRYSWPPSSNFNDANAACRCYDIADDLTSTYPTEIPTEPAKGNFPSLEVYVNDVAQTLYVHYPEWISSIKADKNSLSLDYKNRMYLSTVDYSDADKYFKVNLLDGYLSFDVDLSKSGCGCLSALYTIMMPAVDNESDTFKYCDGSQVGGPNCPEFDLMQANKHAYRATAHRCDAPDATGKYSSCDRDGECYVDIHENENNSDFGAGSAYSINTEKVFNVNTVFYEQDGQFVGFTTTLSQEGRKVMLNKNDCAEYLKDMTASIQNMVLAISTESVDQLDWLQNGICSGTCNEQTTLSVFSNIRIYTKKDTGPDQSKSETIPTPKPIDSGDIIDVGFPPLSVQINDETRYLYVHYPEWVDEITTDKNILSFDFNNRMYLSTQSGRDTSKYFTVNLLGGNVQFDIDLSKAGCGCLTALYTVAMPGIDNSWDDFQYCDSGRGGGSICPEFDLMEANKFAYRATAHRCNTRSAAGKYQFCDSNGSCSVDVLQNNLDNDFGPGKSNTINTDKAFNVKTEFHVKDEKFAGYSTTLSQEGRTVVLEKSDCQDYLQDMTQAMKAMVFAIKNWGSHSFDWLQHGVCGGQCDPKTTFSEFSNIKINTKDPVLEDLDTEPTRSAGPGPAPKPEPNPVSIPIPLVPDQGELDDYEFGDVCLGQSDQLCQQYDCVSCLWSWPIGQTWEHSDAMCRCKQIRSLWSWGETCSIKDEFCNYLDCESCRKSWPFDSTSADPNTACRCEILVQKENNQIVTDASIQFRPGQTGNFPPLSVIVNDEEKILYVQYPDWSSAAVMDKKTLKFDYSNRMYLSKTQTVDSSQMFKANLLDGWISFDIDLNKSGCGCLTALYAVTMPAADNLSDPFKYCDSAQIGGHFCPEFDLMQANRFAYRATAHSCDAPTSSGFYENCDRSGNCSIDVLLNDAKNDFGPGASYTINTEEVFNIKTEFHEKDQQFIGYTTTMTQEGRNLVFEIKDCDAYLKRMTADIQNMSIVISNWGSYSLNWLQHGVCSGGCDPLNTLSSVSNLKIKMRPEPEPEVIPTVPVPETFPTLSINIDGIDNELYVLHPIQSEGILTTDDQLGIKFDNRAYLSKVNGVVPSKYFKLNMLGTILTYDVDLSDAGCGCVIAFYMTRMPAMANLYDPFRYCDSKQDGGYFCPEFDIMEANKFAYRSTGHRCVDPDAETGIYSNCDREGQCQIDVFEEGESSQQDFGPSADFTIDTTYKFTVVTHFNEFNGKFTGYNTVLSQNGKTVVLKMNNCKYLEDLSADMMDMVPVFKTWGSNDGLDWLQHGSCTGSCDPFTSGAVISNISIMTKKLVPKSLSPLSALDPGPSTLANAQSLMMAAAIMVSFFLTF